MGDLKKITGRPPVTAGKRTRRFNVRFTEEEYARVAELEKELGLSKTELIRTRVLKDSQKIVLNSRELLGHLDALGAELRRAGNNINQLARHANAQRLQGAVSPSVTIKLVELLERLTLIQLRLETALRKIIRQGG